MRRCARKKNINRYDIAELWNIVYRFLEDNKINRSSIFERRKTSNELVKKIKINKLKGKKK